MKKLSLLLLLVFLTSPMQASAEAPTNTVGRILLQVESKGEAWYVSPITKDRFYLPNGAAAYSALEKFGLGITNNDISKIPVGIESRFEDTDTDHDGLSDKLEESIGTNFLEMDTDGDNFTDLQEILAGYNPLSAGATQIDTNLANRLKGQIVLQVESRGEAWYINPVDAKRYYMKDGDAAYQIMKYLSLGITNSDLETIPTSNKVIDCKESLPCFISSVESNQPTELSINISQLYHGVTISGHSNASFTPANNEQPYIFTASADNYKAEINRETLVYLMANGNSFEEISDTLISANQELERANGNTMECTSSDKHTLIRSLKELEEGESYNELLDYGSYCTSDWGEIYSNEFTNLALKIWSMFQR